MYTRIAATCVIRSETIIDVSRHIGKPTQPPGCVAIEVNLLKMKMRLKLPLQSLVEAVEVSEYRLFMCLKQVSSLKSWF